MTRTDTNVRVHSLHFYYSSTQIFLVFGDHIKNSYVDIGRCRYKVISNKGISIPSETRVNLSKSIPISKSKCLLSAEKHFTYTKLHRPREGLPYHTKQSYLLHTTQYYIMYQNI